MPSIIGAQNLILDNSGVEANGRTLRLKDLGVTAGKLAADAVTTTKIADNAVTPAKADLTATWSFSADALRIASDATNASAVVSKSQMETHVANSVSGILRKANAKYATAAALASYTFSAGVITASANGALSVDGASPSVSDRILVKNESGANEKYNGIWTVQATGDGSNPFELIRATDSDIAAELVEGQFIWVSDGSTNANKRWQIVVGPTTLNTDPVTWDTYGTTSDLIDGNGVVISGGEILIESADDSMQINAASIQVKLASAGAIEVSAGNGLAVKLNGSTLSKDSSGLKVAADGITATEIADNAVDSAQIAGGAVTSAKLSMLPVFQRIVGNSANGATLTLSQSVPSGWEPAVILTEDGAPIDYVASSPDTSPSPEFTVSGTTITLGYTQVTDAVYRVHYHYDA